MHSCVKIQNDSLPPILLYPFQKTTPPIPSPWHHWSILHFRNFVFSEFYVNGITLDLAFEPLVSPTLDALTMHIRDTSVHGGFLFIAGDPIAWINYSLLPLPAEAHVPHFWFWVVMNVAASHTRIQVSVWMWFSFMRKQYVHGIS